MTLGRALARMTRATVICLTAALSVVGVVASCSSEEKSPIEADIVMPNLIGMHWQDAEPKLRSLGWTGAIVKGPEVQAGPQDRLRVIIQNPAAGEHLDRDGEITLQFGA
jgi:beta-lactam-binding protein with PASTA domain